MKILSYLQFLCLAAAAVTVSASEVRELSELEIRAYRDVQILYDSLVGVSRRNPEATKFTRGLNLLDLLGKKASSGGRFDFTSCGDATSDLMVATNVSLRPDPVVLPGNLQVSADVNIKAPFGSPIKTELKVWKEEFGIWVEVPCIDNFGSCTYDDFCKLFDPSQCPPELQKAGFPCECPFKAGSWSFPSVSFNVPSELPIHGGVRARLSASYNGNQIMCAQATVELA